MQRFEILAEQGADDVLDVAARAEGAAGAGDHDRPHAGLRIERAKGVAELGIGGERKGVEAFGPIQR